MPVPACFFNKIDPLFAYTHVISYKSSNFSLFGLKSGKKKHTPAD